jgi:predicted membrane channel-forming protein YqfA (hemolysin III family)
MRLRNLASSFSSTKVPTLSCYHVRWTGSVFHRTYPSRNYEVWLGDTDVENESGLDGTDDDIQSYRWCAVCNEGKYAFSLDNRHPEGSKIAATDAYQIPEKWYPYRHDVWGASHQVMHCLVICAGIAHLFGLLRSFDHVHSGDICEV